MISKGPKVDDLGAVGVGYADGVVFGEGDGFAGAGWDFNLCLRLLLG